MLFVTKMKRNHVILVLIDDSLTLKSRQNERFCRCVMNTADCIAFSISQHYSKVFICLLYLNTIERLRRLFVICIKPQRSFWPASPSSQAVITQSQEDVAYLKLRIIF